ncbi:MAG: hypothetical protein KDA28_06745, partial [Phycisphaerales bacterium]|nr:hypothetical protein [Phycisphaerales bacterium]
VRDQREKRPSTGIGPGDPIHSVHSRTGGPLMLTLSCVALGLVGGSVATPPQDRFHPPVRLTAGGEVISVESPGFACPSWTDLDGDGHGDLLVGQFNQGKIRVYAGSEGGLTEGQWLRAGGKIAEIPGVW